jgi:hypothetical protein
MSDLITTVAPPLVPYVAANVLRDNYDHAISLTEDWCRVDSSGKLICLEEAKTERQRWQLGDNARYALRKELPRLADVRPVLAALDLDLDTEPSIEQRVDLVGTMLDIQGITPDLKYIRYVAQKLGDCPPRKTETCKRSQPWFSLATISRTVDEVLSTLRPQDGRPIPPADILDIAGKHASELISLRRSVVTLNNTIVRLQRIVEATKDAAKPVFKDAEWDIDGSEPGAQAPGRPEPKLIEIIDIDGTIITVPDQDEP